MPRYSLRLGSRKVPIATTDSALSDAIGKRLAGAEPQTAVDSISAGTGYSFSGQEIDFEDLRDIKDMRESGGQVAQLMDYKGLLNFGEGAELHVEDNEDTEQVIDGEPMTLEAWLESQFPRLDLTVLDLGSDALWYPAAVGELRETQAGDFKEFLPAEPWTVLPVTNDHGEIIAWKQQVIQNGTRKEQTLNADVLCNIVLNKQSARDKTGISEVLRNDDEIRAFKENEQAINNAIELHGFPQRHVKLGREEGAPVRDDDLRRVRTLFDPHNTDANTAYFTGRDVDVETLEAEQFDVGAIHEMDMRNLTTALGLPLETGNVGADGLGSGKPAELRFALLKLAIKANQRSFSTQFIDKVVRPVIRDYSPFDHTATVTMTIDDPLEDIGETADLINSIGDYMTNAEARRRLDLPEPEDDDVAESYRSPADIERDEEGDGIQEGLGGLFRDGRALQTPEGVPDNAVSISDRSEAPEGASVVAGPAGGLYYVPGGDDSDGRSESGRRQEISEIAESDMPADEKKAEFESIVSDSTGVSDVDFSDFGEQQAAQTSEALVVLGEAGQTEGIEEITTDVSGPVGESGAVANYDPFDRTIRIDADKFTQDKAESWGDNGYLAGDTIEHLVAHEVGHHNHFQKQVDGQSAGMQAQTQEIPDDARPVFAEEVSVYGVENVNELVAELYAMKVTGQELDIGMENAYEEFNGPEVSV